MNKCLIKVTAMLVLSLLVVGCNSLMEEDTPASDSGKIQVVTTIFPLSDIILQVGGEKVEVNNLLEAGDSPHTFDPTVEQARQIARSEFLFYIGGGLDDWVVEMGKEEEVTLVSVTEQLDEDVLLDYESEHLEGEHHGNREDHDCGGDSHEHHHGAFDPHLWLDPILVKEKIAPLAAEKLSGAVPAKEEYFAENLEEFQSELQELDREIEEAVESIQDREFISYHSAWNYYARRYGFEEVASVEEFPGREPSAKWLAELAGLAEEHGIDVIFAEPQLREDNAQVIAEEIEGEVLILDPLGGEEIPGRDSYLELIRYNTDVFRRGLE